ncbi:unnamed protein product [Cochlearia groenlandica]
MKIFDCFISSSSLDSESHSFHNDSSFLSIGVKPNVVKVEQKTLEATAAHHLISSLPPRHDAESQNPTITVAKKKPVVEGATRATHR